MRCIGEMKLTRTEMDVDVKRRRFLARSAAASRKRRRDEATFDLTWDARPAPTVSAAAVAVVGNLGFQQSDSGSGAQTTPDKPAVKHGAATSKGCLNAAPSAARDSWRYYTGVPSDPPNLYSFMHSHSAQEQQHVQDDAAVDVSMPSANSYQRLQIQTSTAANYAANHDSFRMLSNAMAGHPATSPCPPGLFPQSRSAQPPSCPVMQGKLASEQQRTLTANPAVAHAGDQGHTERSKAEVPTTMERQLHTPRRKLQASGPFCPGTLWPPALDTPHSPASEALNHSIACAAGTAGSAGTHSLAEDACAAPLLRPASSQQASTSWLLDPRLPLAPDIAQALPASLPPLSKTSPSPHLACTSAQTRSLYSQFLAEGFSTQDPQAASVQLPPVCGGATPPSRGGPDSRCDDSVAITHSHRQTWDWTHGPLYSFRALRQTQEQRQQQRRQQQEQLLIVCHRRLLKSSRVNSSRTFLSEAQKQWQSPVQMLDTRSIMSGLSSQQPSLLHVTGAQACISSRSSSASQPYCSPPPAYLNGLTPQEARVNTLHAPLSYCDSSSLQQPLHNSSLRPQQPHRPLRCSSSPTVPAPLSTLPPPGPQQSSPVCAHTSSSELSPLQQPPFCYPQTSTPASVPVSPSQAVSCFSFFPSQQATQSASSCTQSQIPQTPSVSRAPSFPKPWQTHQGRPNQQGVSPPLSVATVPDSNSIRACSSRLYPKLGFQHGRTWQKGHMGDPCAGELEPDEQSTLEWMASDLVFAGVQSTSLQF